MAFAARAVSLPVLLPTHPPLARIVSLMLAERGYSRWASVFFFCLLSSDDLFYALPQWDLAPLASVVSLCLVAFAPLCAKKEKKEKGKKKATRT